jgi:hypothetical protein
MLKSFFDLTPQPPLHIGEGETSNVWMNLSPLSVWERGFRGEVGLLNYLKLE